MVAGSANALRAQAAAVSRCERGARVCAIGAGAIMSPLARRELKTEIGDVYRVMVYAVAAKRMAPSEEIAGAAAFLSGPDDRVSSPAAIFSSTAA